MHEFSLAQSVLTSVLDAAQAAGALRVTRIRLVVGEMTQVVEEAMRFAMEALSEGTLAQGAGLEMDMVEPKSVCHGCGNEYTHDRYHVTCPACGSLATELVAGRELYIDSIEVDLPEDQEDQGGLEGLEELEAKGA